MRYGSCLNCEMTEEQQQLLAEERHQQSALAALAEMLRSDCHHHHIVRCAGCGSWWFDDTVTGGIPEPARRDTVICGCPEDGYRGTIVMAPMPESECRCTAADAAGYAEPDRMPGGRVRAVRVYWRGGPSPEVTA
jgi:hypothetical protein